MKRISKIILIFAIILAAFIGVKTFATDDDTKLSSTIKVTAPEAGIYGVGQEITIKIEFNKKIKGQMPKYSIYFGESTSEKIELETPELTEFSNEVVYKYTIKSGDNGELKPDGFVSTVGYTVEDEAGNKYYLTSGFVMRFDKKILADTTTKWTDLNKAEIKINVESSTRDDFSILFENVKLNSDNSYYVHISHNPEEKITLKDSSDIYNNMHDKGTKTWQTTLNTINNKVNSNENIRNLFAEAGDIYITVCEIDRKTDVPKIVLQSKKIDRLELLPLTQRITAFFFDDYTSTLCWEMHGENERKVNYKIGKVTDLGLLKKLKNGEKSAFSELLEYSKKAESIANGSIKLGDKEKSIINNMKLVDDAYYYVYLELDTENGKYYPIEDVSLYQALVSEEGKNIQLTSVKDKEFKWNLDDEKTNPNKESNDKKKDDTIAKDKLPNTGINVIIAILTVSILTIMLVSLKKCKSYKDIK